MRKRPSSPPAGVPSAVRLGPVVTAIGCTLVHAGGTGLGHPLGRAPSGLRPVLRGGKGVPARAERSETLPPRRFGRRALPDRARGCPVAPIPEGGPGCGGSAPAGEFIEAGMPLPPSLRCGGRAVTGGSGGALARQPPRAVRPRAKGAGPRLPPSVGEIPGYVGSCDIRALVTAQPRAGRRIRGS